MDEGRIRWHQVTPAERERIREAAAQVLERRPWVKAAWLYGSAARGDRPSRDIDIGVLADPVPHSREPVQIAGELAAATGISEVDFDVREVNAGSPVHVAGLQTGLGAGPLPGAPAVVP
ncbi:MAG: nucleotidyltransferase domain-containing protein [Myxococcales bacterium]|nr:nucleotidyltransferase domain-containing protein [Myxococcales bacterium]